jgi:hypothetical protein
MLTYIFYAPVEPQRSTDLNQTLHLSRLYNNTKSLVAVHMNKLEGEKRYGAFKTVRDDDP